VRISQIKAALAAAVQAAAIKLPGAGKLQAYPHSPAAPHVPAFTIGAVAIDPLGTFLNGQNRGLQTLDFTCSVLTSTAEDDAGQQALDELISLDGPYSIYQAILAARGEPGELALDGLAHDLYVPRIDGYRMLSYADDAAQYYGADLTVRVIGE
jgi:hypothetical protein